jgi:ABC-type polysaccharide/polyol phosphate export permease
MNICRGAGVAMLRAIIAVIRRDLILKYQHTLLGPLWTLAKPWLQVWALYLLFSTLNRSAAGADFVPNLMVIYFAVILWQFIVSSLADGGLSLVANPTLVQRTRIPLAALPLAACCFYFLELLAHVLVGIVLLWWFGELATLHLWVLPNVLLASLLLSAGLAMTLAPFNFYFKDVRFLMPLIFQIGFILTPVAGSIPQLAGQSIDWLRLNPIMLLINQLTHLSSRISAPLASDNSFWFWALGALALGSWSLKIFGQKGRQ